MSVRMRQGRRPTAELSRPLAPRPVQDALVRQPLFGVLRSAERLGRLGRLLDRLLAFRPVLRVLNAENGHLPATCPRLLLDDLLRPPLDALAVGRQVGEQVLVGKLDQAVQLLRLLGKLSGELARLGAALPDVLALVEAVEEFQRLQPRLLALGGLDDRLQERAAITRLHRAPRSLAAAA